MNKITCPCGETISKSAMHLHRSSSKHRNYLVDIQVKKELLLVKKKKNLMKSVDKDKEFADVIVIEGSFMNVKPSVI
jgi:hypothetical protein